MNTSQPLLSVRGVSVQIPTRAGVITPVRDVSFDITPGQRVGLVGESGSGKSMTALAIMRLVKAPGRIAAGEILLEGQDLLRLKPAEMADVRGNRIAMVYQNPLSALNPVQTVGHQLIEAIRLHQDLDKRTARDHAIDLLREVGVPLPAQRIGDYPHQFSGGMLQRAVIAMALSCDPDLVIADEATTALDVTTQARIVELLLRLVSERRTAIMFITHDLGVAAAVCEEVQVMYAGRIVERASASRFYSAPVHPYSHGLLQSICRLDAAPDESFSTIPGAAPMAGQLPPGCSFHPRCPHAQDVCRTEVPPIVTVHRGAYAECHFAAELQDLEVGRHDAIRR